MIIMKIGTIFSTCIHDLASSKVDEAEVLLILDVVRYDFTKLSEWDRCWYNMNQSDVATTTWDDLEELKVKRIVMDLARKKKIHVYNHSEYNKDQIFWTAWLNLTIPDESLDELPGLREIWREYLFISGLNKL